ncbi:MAG TPA: PQQ-dependent sugar dehydrogenase [Steroidobacteraceae bacterium]|jgi:glucose/arabinose dehydrogenase
MSGSSSVFGNTRAFALAAILLAASSVVAAAERCPGDDPGIVLPPGFCASVFADDLGHVRHLAIAANGDVYANTWSSFLYRTPPPPGGFLLALRDTHASGRADQIRRFGSSPAEGASGGTGIALYHGALYAEQGDRILRYRLSGGALLPSAAPAVIVSGLPMTGDHNMHPFVIDARGNLFMDSGSATNACQQANRMPQSPGETPCTELATRGGIWRFDANRTGQKFSAAQRYATGIRNGEGLSFDSAGRLFVTQHGRDQLRENWPDLYSVAIGRELPAEELMQLQHDADYGWPGCYFDGSQQRLVLSPEYGGDGGHALGDCAGKHGPLAWFPAHWAPNDLLIYQGQQFPPPYRGGAFIAFHGSWNRAPGPQGGYDVVYQPLHNGRAAGPYVVFADGFAGAEIAPGRAQFRPTGLAMGPDGALFVSDDQRGRIWRITWRGGADAPTTLASVSVPKAAGAHDARPALDSLPLPPGGTREQLQQGERIFHGEASDGTCGGCHSSDGKGSMVGADLSTGQWLWSDGSVGGIANTIMQGVPHAKRTLGSMPPLGGAPLAAADVQAVAAYVWALGHAQGH